MPELKKKKTYEEVSRRLFGRYPFDATDTPDEMIVRSSGPGPEGWYVYPIWEEESDFERFRETQLAPALREVPGIDIRVRKLQFYEVANLAVKAHARSDASTRRVAATSARAGVKA